MRQGAASWGSWERKACTAASPAAPAPTRSAAACAPSAALRRRPVMEGGPCPLFVSASTSGSPARSSSRRVRPPKAFPRTAAAPVQIIGRPDDIERLLDEAGQRAREVERGAAQAIEDTAAVAAEEGEAVAAEGVGGAFGYLEGLAEGAAALAPTAGEVAVGWRGRSWRGGNGGAGRGHRRRRSLRPRARHGLGAGEHALPAPAGQRGRGRAGRPVRQQHE